MGWVLTKEGWIEEPATTVMPALNLAPSITERESDRPQVLKPVPPRTREEAARQAAQQRREAQAP